MFWTSVHGFFPDLSCSFNLVLVIAAKMCILGFHMTSPNIDSSESLSFMRYYST